MISDINAPVLPNERIASDLFSFTDLIAKYMLERLLDLMISDGLSFIEIKVSEQSIISDLHVEVF